MVEICGTGLIEGRKYQSLSVEILAELGMKEAMTAFGIYTDNKEMGLLEKAYRESATIDGDHSVARHVAVWISLEASASFISFLLMKSRKSYLAHSRETKDGYFADEYPMDAPVSKCRIEKIAMPLTYFEIAELVGRGYTSISWKRFTMQLLRRLKYPKLLPLQGEMRKDLIDALEIHTD